MVSTSVPRVLSSLLRQTPLSREQIPHSYPRPNPNQYFDQTHGDSRLLLARLEWQGFGGFALLVDGNGKVLGVSLYYYMSVRSPNFSIVLLSCE